MKFSFARISCIVDISVFLDSILPIKIIPYQVNWFETGIALMPPPNIPFSTTNVAEQQFCLLVLLAYAALALPPCYCTECAGRTLTNDFSTTLPSARCMSYARATQVSGPALIDAAPRCKEVGYDAPQVHGRGSVRDAIRATQLPYRTKLLCQYPPSYSLSRPSPSRRTRRH